MKELVVEGKGESRCCDHGDGNRIEKMSQKEV